MELNKIYNEDCLETLNRMEDESIDCVITDPPYSGLTSKSKNGRFSNNCHIEMDDMSERAFLLFMKPIFREMYRVLKMGSHLYCFTDWKQLRNMADCIELAGFKIVNIVCWNKGHFGTGAGYRSQSEYFLVFSKGLANTFNLRNVGNVITVKRAKDSIHPHQKPTELLKILIENSTNKNEVVYDAFAGSGSTLISAKALKRKFIGSELSNDYCNKINDIINEPSLFTQE